MQLFANDYNDNRVYIDETHSNQQYFCPTCGVPLIARKGSIRHHHFAHSAHRPCKDSWERNQEYDTSSWHREWQSCYPKDNQEVILSLGETKHRADVLVDRTVIEFQHSLLSSGRFDDRNNFYFNLGYKVIWLFDITAYFQKGNISYQEHENELQFSWKNPKEAFNAYDVQNGKIDLFFQISDAPECIVRVKAVSPNGFECFVCTPLITKKDFLRYTGLYNGQCLPPDKMSAEKDALYTAFKQKYKIELNKQQERALQAVEGANLLLAVPGSGKTTVLVDRLGFMVFCKGINPGNILAITFGNNAANEMRSRFTKIFGEEHGSLIDFRTINSLSLQIYRKRCEMTKAPYRSLISDRDQKKLLRNLYYKFHGEHAAENDIIALKTGICYTKNMMLTAEQLKSIDNEYAHFSEMFSEYQTCLEADNLMDFDDQMCFAYSILNEDDYILSSLRSRYRYICVDEAQDTSKVQHAIIKLLAKNSNVFMVGDEDQSIYGFRGAYPRALLNFRYAYTNPYILRMEKNYRSTPEIVSLAQKFISQNKGRYEKNMVAARESGDPIELIKVKTREEQYHYLIDIAKHRTRETAFLYRDNESAVVLIDLLLRANLDFQLRKPEMNFFGHSVVKDIVAYLSLATNEMDADAFEQICDHGILYLGKQQKKCAANTCRFQHKSVFDCLDQQMAYVKREYRDRADMFRQFIKEVSNCSSIDAIDHILDEGYDVYLEKKGFDKGKIDILRILAKQEPSLRQFLIRLKKLELEMGNDTESVAENPLILSTIHSSKGLEYDTVYLIDIYDGRFPSSRPNLFSRAKDNADGEMEERRLFYVGMTRAKNNLSFISIGESSSTFLEELFPKIREDKEEALRREQQCIREEQEKARLQAEEIRKQEEQRRYEEYLRYMAARKEQEIINQEKARAAKEAEEKTLSEKCYAEAQKLVNQQASIAFDSIGRRWVKCTICGEIKLSSEFTSYGGKGTINLGKCKKCCGMASQI